MQGLCPLKTAYRGHSSKRNLFTKKSLHPISSTSLMYLIHKQSVYLANELFEST